MTVERRSQRFSSGRLEKVARVLMKASPLCSLATVGPGARAHVSHMYFAWNDRFDVFWISDPGSLHSRNLAARPTAAVTIYDSRQTWGRPDRGIQLFGSGALTRGASAMEARRAYEARFRDFDAEATDLPFYRFRARRLKLFAESELGAATFVTARVGAGGLTWLRTEVLV